ncbi:MAG: hypothetical protein LC796_12310 [Acidobacteria bacterium]|nr:hypothetical protein [Acidobacteriota bacterium]MCA1609918.1 hypothetical protein [Acidobacteriota bacterium]
MTAERAWGIYRELVHSPGRETDDALILRAVAGCLERQGFSVSLTTAEELTGGGKERPESLFVMCERLPVLERLAGWEAEGACVLNRPAGVRNTYRDRTAAIFAREGVRFPASVLVSTSERPPLGPGDAIDLGGLWIKRGDVHATEEGDVLRPPDTAAALLALRDFSRRGVARALLQEHVPGDLVKFYGVAAPEPGAPAWFEWFYHRDQDLENHPFDPAALRRAAEGAAGALELDVWGGDAIVPPGGDPVVIDLNAWPSFALFRETAAARIAAFLAARFRSHVRTGVTE